MGALPAPTQAEGAAGWWQTNHQVTDPDRTLGLVPREPTQRTAWQHARQAIEWVQGRRRRPDRDRQPQPGAASRPSPVDRELQDQPPPHPRRDAPPRRSGPERAAG